MNGVALDTVACHDCELQQRVPLLPPGGKAVCARCKMTIARNPADPIDLPLALAITAAVVFLIANLTPLMGMSVAGIDSSTTILGAAWQTWLRGSELAAVSVGFCAVVAPGLFIAFMLLMLLAARRPPAPRWVGRLLRMSASVQPWSMSEVMLLGVLVALIKVSQVATVVPGVGLFALGVLVVLLAALGSSFDSHAIWRRVVWADGTRPALSATGAAKQSDVPSLAVEPSARRALVSCTSCGLLSHPAPDAQRGHCPRCGAALTEAPHTSIQVTWALVIAAAILYIPANSLPVLISTALGASQSDTIISGVAYLYQSGSWSLALIVLVASVIVPLGKIVALGYLLITVQQGSVKNNQDRTRLYRLVEFVGRWSMLDVFVDSFIVALVQLEPLMSVKPGPGVALFMSVVVLTVLAARSFDPRLIWNAGRFKQTQHD
jgi:paraquat-inducible protein A